MGQKIWCRWRHGPRTAIFQTRGAMRQRILGSHTPPCHRRMVIITLSSMFCLAALQCKPDQCRMLPCVRHSRWLSKVLRLFGSARSHHPPTAPVSLKPLKLGGGGGRIQGPGPAAPPVGNGLFPGPHWTGPGRPPPPRGQRALSRAPLVHHRGSNGPPSAANPPPPPPRHGRRPAGGLGLPHAGLVPVQQMDVLPIPAGVHRVRRANVESDPHSSEGRMMRVRLDGWGEGARG